MRERKFMAAALAASMTFACAMPALAANAGEGGNSTDVTYTVASAYSVTIPDSLDLSTSTDLNVSIGANPVIPYNNRIQITLTAANNYDAANSKFRLKLADQNAYINYMINKGNDAVALNTVILEQTAGTATEASATLSFSPETAVYAGEYSDQLTFNVGVAKEQVTFSIRDYYSPYTYGPYTVDEGTTWRQFAETNSSYSVDGYYFWVMGDYYHGGYCVAGIRPDDTITAGEYRTESKNGMVE